MIEFIGNGFYFMYKSWLVMIFAYCFLVGAFVTIEDLFKFSKRITKWTSLKFKHKKRD